jgi:hypothetical protein
VSADPLAACMLCGNVSGVQSKQVSVFPNPSEGEFTIQWKGEVYTRIEIFDATGKTIVKEKLLQQDIFKANEKLKSGVYLVKLSNEKSIVTQKLIVN